MNKAQFEQLSTRLLA